VWIYIELDAFSGVLLIRKSVEKCLKCTL